MARVTAVDKLPHDIRQELDAELIRTSFSNFDHLTSWLEEKGYPVARSVIHRYAVKHREEILGLHVGSRYELANLKLSALKIAAMLYPEKSVDSLKMDAEAIIDWAIKE
ncbi:phage protein Gp27 family protein [Brenneria populi subsp. brevivirga]|uniref:phage protein Gp27 family protein n=1 Tax=Brenneria populi TaxID=1505588 RepID=UPI002E189F60|nr:phage protein Gp27 family protein [Brenneria populi subsp. brevivirga]